MPALAEIVRVIRCNACPPVRILLGGAPSTQQFGDEIGDDGDAADAGSAVERAQAMVGII